jgi:hypothetical protein
MAKQTARGLELKNLSEQVKKLQEELIVAKKKEGIDEFILVKVKKDQARFKRVKKEGEKDKGFGNFFLMISITAKQADVFIPLSISSGKKVSGFMYQIEGTAEGVISNADVTVRGDGVTQLTVGTLVYARVPAGTTGEFRIMATIRGKIGKSYKITLTRINYKLAVADVRYQQYLKEIVSDTVKFS